MNENNDIKVLEEFIGKQKSNKGTFVPTDFEITAIENLIKENKELKEMLKHRIKYTNELEKDLFENASNYVIPKSALQELLDIDEIGVVHCRLKRLLGDDK